MQLGMMMALNLIFSCMLRKRWRRKDSRIHRQIATNAGRPEASRKTAAALYEILMKIGKKEMQKAG